MNIYAVLTCHDHLPFAGLFSTYSEVLASPKPLPSAIGGLFGAGVVISANLKQAVTRSRIAAKEGVGQGRLSSSCGSNYHDPGVRKVRDKRPLAANRAESTKEDCHCQQVPS